MPQLLCPFPGCAIETNHEDKEMAIALFNAHVMTHTAGGGAAGAGHSKAEKLSRPKLSQGLLEENWNSFVLQWNMYKDGTGITGVESARQLLHCCDPELLEFDILQSVKNIAGHPVLNRLCLDK